MARRASDGHPNLPVNSPPRFGRLWRIVNGICDPILLLA